ncbi:hypothetical protein [Gordonia malaquae]|uniref:hypothetical protein n=1 Tax=Gordonia malaquae TaxID=410332 RepID=UPI0030FEDD63
MSEQDYAVVHYAGTVFNVAPAIADQISDAIDGLDALGGSHVYRMGGEGERKTSLWLAPGVPIAIVFPVGYESPDDREDYVVKRLQTEARYRLGLPYDGSGDNANARLDG